MERTEKHIDDFSKEELGDIVVTQTAMIDHMVKSMVKAKGILDYVLRNNSDANLHNRCYHWIQDYEKFGIKLEAKDNG